MPVSGYVFKRYSFALGTDALKRWGVLGRGFRQGAADQTLEEIDHSACDMKKIVQF
jgi:hypothetical protein